MGMTPAIDITAEQRKTLLPLLRRFIPDVAVWAYGSRVKWTARTNSDLDLVAFTTPAQWPFVSELRDALAESNIPFLVDLHVWEEVPERFREIIRKEYVVLQEAEEKLGRGTAGDSWDRRVFQDLIDAGLLEIGDGYRAKNEELDGTGALFLRAGHVTDIEIDFDGVERFRAELSDRVKPKMAMVGDTIVTTKGNSTGRTSFVSSRMPPFVYSPHLSYWRSLDDNCLVPGFLRYWSRGIEFRTQLEGMKASTDMAPYLSLTDQRRLGITLPPAKYQKAVADILGSLDDKIESNRRTSRALERVARAIFRAWFVDFEPVKAKAAGALSFPSMSQNAFETIPTRLLPSKLGPIPEGWDTGRLGDNCEINAIIVRKDEIKGQIEYIDISSVTVGRLDSVLTLPFAHAPSRARRRVRHGDTIWSCVRPNHRSYLFIHAPPENRIVSTGFAVLSPQHFGPSFLHELTIQPEFVDYLVSNADGSAYPAVRPDHFAAAEVLVPPSSLLNTFEAITMPCRDLVASADRECAKLASLRDCLLPKLLSGAVRVAADSVGANFAPTAKPPEERSGHD